MDKRAKALLIVRSSIVPAREAEFNQWYNEVELPEMVRVPGILSARRYVSLLDEPKYASVYELEDESVLRSEPYLNVSVGRRSGGLPAKYGKDLTGYVRHTFRLIHSVEADQ